jgi:hypothetical protein
MQPSATSSAVRYDERLTAPPGWWVITGLLALSGGLVALPLGVLPMLVGVISVAVLAGTVVSNYGNTRIRVVAGSLVAGGARIPLTALGEPEPLDEAEARAWRSHKADPRAFMVLRSYVRTAVRVEVTDPDDPTPYVYLSTRDPEALAAALRG